MGKIQCRLRVDCDIEVDSGMYVEREPNSGGRPCSRMEVCVCCIAAVLIEASMEQL